MKCLIYVLINISFVFLFPLWLSEKFILDYIDETYDYEAYVKGIRSREELHEISQRIQAEISHPGEERAMAYYKNSDLYGALIVLFIDFLLYFFRVLPRKGCFYTSSLLLAFPLMAHGYYYLLVLALRGFIAVKLYRE